jgi:hypothetical protein
MPVRKTSVANASTPAAKASVTRSRMGRVGVSDRVRKCPSAKQAAQNTMTISQHNA